MLGWSDNHLKVQSMSFTVMWSKKQSKLNVEEKQEIQLLLQQYLQEERR